MKNKSFTTLVLLSIFLLCASLLNAQIKIGDNPTNIDPRALVEMESNNKAFYLPRLSTVQINAQTGWKAGMFVYNTTDSCVQVFDGIVWSSLLPGLLQETDPEVSPSVVGKIPRWNGTALVDGSIFDNGGGNVGVGNNSPETKLHVTGAIASTPITVSAANSINVPANFSNIIIAFSVTSTTNIVIPTDPKEGQYLTVSNSDNDPASLNGTTIPTGTASAFVFLNGAWRATSPSGNTWNRGGNAGTNSQVDFIGTTDNQGLTFKVNNIYAGSINATDNSVTLGEKSGDGPGVTRQDFVGIGDSAAASSTHNLGSVVIGSKAASNSTTTGGIAIGYKAAQNTSLTNDGIIIGYEAGKNASQSGIYIGRESGNANQVPNNIMIGSASGKNNTTGSANTFVGNSAGFFNITGGENTFLGSLAGAQNITGGNNTYLGNEASIGNKSGSFNVALGSDAGATDTSGSFNTYLGAGSGLSVNNGGTQNTYVGHGTGVAFSNVDNPLVNATAIGASTRVRKSNTVILGTNANVGINTDNPLYKLHVAGKARIDDTLRLSYSTPQTGKYLRATGTDGALAWSDMQINAIAPLISSPGPIPQISMTQASLTQNGYLDAGDFTTFWNGVMAPDEIVPSFPLTGSGHPSSPLTISTSGALDGMVLTYHSGSGTWGPDFASGSETDPEVNVSNTNAVPRWNGTQLVNGSLQDHGSFIVTGVPFVSSSNIETNNLQIANGATTGYILRSSNNFGLAQWVDPATLGLGGSNLDNSYDFGGAGNGRIINATDGALRVNGDDGFLVTGTFGSGDNIEVTGAGTRMFFNPRKAAFRTGFVSGNQWAVDSIGNYSFASGENNVASGTHTIAMGQFSKAYDYGSISLGLNNLSSGEGSSAIGYSNTSSAMGTSAIGYNNIASGTRSVAIGDENTASGMSSIALGKSNEATGDGSFVAGWDNQAIGNYSTVFGTASTTFANLAFAAGIYNNINGEVAIALGSTNTVNGNHAVALGIGNTANSFGEVVVGPYANSGGGTFDAFVPFDRVFTVGNGSSSGSKSDALVILKNGNTGIGFSNPSERLDVNGKTRTTEFQMTNNAAPGHILSSDASGNASWVDPITVTSSTLDQAYHFGGLGGGREITADMGALRVNGDDGFIVTGTFGTGDIIETVGAGTRMFFNPKKAAFRAGEVNNIFWNDFALGNHSFASGYNTIATGDYGTAFGNASSASGPASTAFGDNVSAEGASSVAMGGFTRASGSVSTAMGFDTEATGTNSTAMGDHTEAGGTASTAMGSQTSALGENSTTMGLNTEAVGENAVAMGNSSSADGENAVAMGFNTQADGQNSIAMGSGSIASQDGSIAIGSTSEASEINAIAFGNNTKARSASETAMGMFNTDYSPTNTNSDRLFVIGNGVDNATRSDALVVLKNGNIGIGIDSPSDKLEVVGKTKTTTFQMTNGAAANLFLQSDASGNASWVSASAFASGTLDQAYDFGGVGSGRVITASDGAMRINGDDGFIVTGTFGAGDNIEVSGTGTRMFFNPRKAAFRAGGISGNIWDADSVGNYSFAVGNNNTAMALYSATIGFSNRAAGQAAFAAGSGNKATASSAVAIGRNGTASGNFAVAIGNANTASGASSTAMGSGTTASGTASTAMGDDSQASGNTSTAMGNTIAPSFGETTMGLFNTTYTPASTTAFNATDRLLVVGNGTSSAARADALVILKNGKVGFGINPNYKFHFLSTGGASSYRNGILVENTNAVAGEAAISFKNIAIGSASDWIVGMNQGAPLSFAFGTDFTTGNTHMTIDTLGNVGIGNVTPLTTVEVNGGFTLDDASVTANADNQIITVGNQSYLRINGNAAATTRTLILSDGLAIGQILIIECASTGVNGIELPDNDATNNMNLVAARTMGPSDVIQLLWNGTFWAEMYFSNN